MALTRAQIEKACKIVTNEADLLSTQEITDISKDLADEEIFDSAGSAEFAIIRLHILINGYAPYGITDHSASVMFSNHSKLMIEIVESKYDVDIESNIQQARDDCDRRKEEVQRRKDREAKAQSELWNYYTAHKSELPATITKQRDNIKAAFVDGLSMEEAFQQFAV